MLLVVHTAPGVVETNYMWLPTWIGMNSAVLKALNEHLAVKAVGEPLNDETLHMLHDAGVKFLRDKYPDIRGLAEYLDHLRQVDFSGNEG